MTAAASDRAMGTAEEVYAGTLRPGLQARTFRSIDRLFPSRTVPAGPESRALPRGEPIGNFSFSSKGSTYDLFDYLALNRVAGLLILKDGCIRLELYELGNTEGSRWMSMSIAKSVTSTLTGAAIQDGLIGSLDDPVVHYLPQLRDSAYDGATVRHVLQMTSGVAWNEDYLDPASDRRRMLLEQVGQRPGAILSFVSSRPRVASPGTRWNYSTGETHILGAIVRAAVRRPLAQYLSEKIWIPVGMEAPASWWLESPDGLEIGGSGISATLRDYGRFGLFLLGGGRAGSIQVLPEGWIEEATTPKTISGQAVPYGYMIWPIASAAGAPTPQAAFEARGIFGQHIYVNRTHGVVVVVWGALPKPVNKAPIADHDFFAAVVQALQQ